MIMTKESFFLSFSFLRCDESMLLISSLHKSDPVWLPLFCCSHQNRLVWHVRAHRTYSNNRNNIFPPLDMATRCFPETADGYWSLDSPAKVCDKQEQPSSNYYDDNTRIIWLPHLEDRSSVSLRPSCPQQDFQDDWHCHQEGKIETIANLPRTPCTSNSNPDNYVDCCEEQSESSSPLMIPVPVPPVLGILVGS